MLYFKDSTKESDVVAIRVKHLQNLSNVPVADEDDQTENTRPKLRSTLGSLLFMRSGMWTVGGHKSKR